MTPSICGNFCGSYPYMGVEFGAECVQSSPGRENVLANVNNSDVIVGILSRKQQKQFSSRIVMHRALGMTRFYVVGQVT